MEGQEKMKIPEMPESWREEEKKEKDWRSIKWDRIGKEGKLSNIRKGCAEKINQDLNRIKVQLGKAGKASGAAIRPIE